MSKKFYKGYNFRFKSKEQHKKVMNKLNYEDNISFQEFIENAIVDYLNDNYNPKK